MNLIRKRQKPLPLKKMEALLARLPKGHPQIPALQRQIARDRKGYEGERKLDYYLKRLPDDFFVLSDYCFHLDCQQVQLDSLIVSPHALFIIEAKNISDELTFNTNLKQCFRSGRQRKEGFKYPITQVENMSFRLETFLQQLQLAHLPIYYFVAFADRSMIYHVIGDEEHFSKVAAYIDDIPLRIMALNKELQEKNPHKGNEQYRNQISSQLMKHVKTFDIDIYREFPIDAADILPGIHCPSCFKLTMKRQNRTWYCPRCQTKSKIAHIKALQEYLLLHGNEISNKTARKFLQLSSRHTMKNLFHQTDCIERTSPRTWMIQSV